MFAELLLFTVAFRSTSTGLGECGSGWLYVLFIASPFHLNSKLKEMTGSACPQMALFNEYRLEVFNRIRHLSAVLRLSKTPHPALSPKGRGFKNMI